MVKINEKAPTFSAQMFHNNNFSKTSLADYKGKWVVLFFYPKDFTFVCPTELADVAAHYKDFQKMNTEVLSVSTDTEVVHKAWHDVSPMIKTVEYPMLADPTGRITRDYGIYIEDEGIAFRGTFIIDPDGVLQAYEVHNDGIGRSAKELLRKLQAAQHVRDHGGEACPANWKPGDKTLTPGIQLVGKL